MDSDTGDALGCGSGTEMNSSPITLNISTTTGGNFSVAVEPENTVEYLKKLIAKRLKVSKDRICLLHRERELQDGTLKDNDLMDGSKIILIPNVETGLLAQRHENTVMQALESLNEVQVNDFLSGKTPLNLSMRLGDHMMLIQLQLSTVHPTKYKNTSKTKSITAAATAATTGSSSSSSSSSSATVTSNRLSDGGNSSSTRNSTYSNSNGHPSNSYNSTDPNQMDIDNNNRLQTQLLAPTTGSATASTSSASTDRYGQTMTTNSRNNLIFASKEFDNIQNVVKPLENVNETSGVTSSTPISTAGPYLEAQSSSTETPQCFTVTQNNQSQLLSASSDDVSTETGLDQSPIKSLSNLVSSPMKTMPISDFGTPEKDDCATKHSDTICTDPISAKLTSCLCDSLNGSHDEAHCSMAPQTTQIDIESKSTIPLPADCTTPRSSRESITLHRTQRNPISRSQHIGHLNKYRFRDIKSTPNSLFLKRSKSTENLRIVNIDANLRKSSSTTSSPSASSTTYLNSATSEPTISRSETAVEPRTLAEASRNLTQTLRKLSKEVFTNKIDLSDDGSRKAVPGAVIQSMKNHGQGIYSGTFSGTLNPALQDRYGRPKKDISTVIHILNDLLSATPQYNRSGARLINNKISKISGLKRQLAIEQQCKGCISSHNHSGSSSTSSCCTIAGTSSALSTNVVGMHKCSSMDGNTKSIHCCHQYRESRNLREQPRGFCCERLNRKYDPDNPLDGDSGTSSADKPEINYMCSKCCNLELENTKIKNKLDQLRLVMQQKREHREARKLKLSPYGNKMKNSSVSLGGSIYPTSSANQATVSAGTIPSSLPATNEATTNHIVEEVDTVA